jgi:hypothetical protein
MADTSPVAADNILIFVKEIDFSLKNLLKH